MPEQKICAHCKNADIPLTDSNSQEIFQRDGEGKKFVWAVVHQTCGNAWALAHSGTLILDVQPAPGVLVEDAPIVPPSAKPSNSTGEIRNWNHPDKE